MTSHAHDHEAPHALDVEQLDFTDPEVQASINELMAACEHADEHLPFGDHELLAIAGGVTEGHLGFGVRRRGTLVGYGHLSTLGGAWFCEIAVHPSHRGRGIATRIIDAIASHVSAHGGGTLSTWSYRPDPAVDGLARHLDLRPVRTLFQLRLRPLPVSAPALPPDVRLDRFRRGRDERDWLAMNARAFANLPDQGSWTLRDLEARMSAQWFMEDDVLLLRGTGDELLGTCWCKIDPGARTHEGEPIGEIYVIGIDPSLTGRGLGRSLVLAGLVHLRERGTTVGMLYVDGRNTPALTLYDSLGFRINHEDVCLATVIA